MVQMNKDILEELMGDEIYRLQIYMIYVMIYMIGFEILSSHE